MSESQMRAALEFISGLRGGDEYLPTGWFSQAATKAAQLTLDGVDVDFERLAVLADQSEAICVLSETTGEPEFDKRAALWQEARTILRMEVS